MLGSLPLYSDFQPLIGENLKEYAKFPSLKILNVNGLSYINRGTKGSFPSWGYTGLRTAVLVDCIGSWDNYLCMNDCVRNGVDVSKSAQHSPPENNSNIWKPSLNGSATHDAPWSG